ncbi:MAG TPA: CHAT domain-containing tetratricopeptide repeat protein, partial [Blastocatellia bacterium]|nr:CHAT domain-containing tetratricopeptide repeat protein [Blastocatellia bacterium]
IASLVHLDKALQLNDSLLEARFNRALWYERMLPPERSKMEWRGYLERDSKSQWADEARQRLFLLEEKQNRLHRQQEGDFLEFLAAARNGDDEKAWVILRRNRTRSDNSITERLIDEYLEAAERGRSEADDRLGVILLAGKLELDGTEDRFTADLAAYYRKTTPSQRNLVRQGRSLLKTGSMNYEKGEFEEAAQLYRDAEAAFARAGDNCEVLVAQSRVGACYLRVPDTDEALAIFERLASYSSQHAYRLMLARSLTSLADVQGTLREFSKALELAARSLKIYESTQDLSGELWSLQAPVANYQEMGELYKSIGFAIRGLDIAESVSSNPREVWPFYYLLAANLNALGYPSLALVFEESALGLANESDTPLLRSRSYASLALIHQKLRNYEDALKTGQLALTEAQFVKNEKVRTNLVAHSTLNLAHVYREMGNADRALSLYDRSIDLHRRLKLPLYLAEAHKGKLETLVAMKDKPAIDGEIKTLLSVLEDDRSRITEDANRGSYFDLAQESYDLAIDFTYSNLHDSRVAFGYSEASHARSLLDLLSTGGEVVNVRDGLDVRASAVSRPLALDEIQRRLPEHCQILQYSVLEEKVIAWVISRDSVECFDRRLSRGELAETVNAFLGAMTAETQGNQDDIGRLAKSLYEILIRPAASRLEQGILFIVPDKILNYLPFGALVCPDSGKYFIEDRVFELAPSSSLVIRCSDLAAERSKQRDERILAVGNPSFDRARFPSLQDLPAAAREAETIAGFYAARPLVGREARVDRVRAQMLDADVIHFAGHYLIHERSPLLSMLLLSKSPD